MWYYAREGKVRESYSKVHVLDLADNLGARGKEGHRLGAQVAQVEFLLCGIHGVS